MKHPTERAQINIIDHLCPPRFMDLPTELRLQIHSHYLPHRRFLTVLSPESRPGMSLTTVALPLGIFRVCRKVSEETPEILYGCNTVRFTICQCIGNCSVEKKLLFNATPEVGLILVSAQIFWSDNRCQCQKHVLRCI